MSYSPPQTASPIPATVALPDGAAQPPVGWEMPLDQQTQFDAALRNAFETAQAHFAHDPVGERGHP